jgi:hypothetical protein
METPLKGDGKGDMTIAGPQVTGETKGEKKLPLVPGAVSQL